MLQILKRAALAAALALAFAAPAAAQRIPGFLTTPMGFCTLTVSSTAVQTSTCFGAYPGGAASYAAVCNEGGAARWTDKGPAPTANFGGGQPFGSGTAAAPYCQPMATTWDTLQWIAQSGTVQLTFTWYK